MEDIKKGGQNVYPSDTLICKDDLDQLCHSMESPWCSQGGPDFLPQDPGNCPLQNHIGVGLW